MFWSLCVQLEVKKISKLFISYKHELCMDLKANNVQMAGGALGNSLIVHL